MVLTLMFRPYCGLCHQMRDALRPLQAELGFDVEIVEIDDFPELEEKYNELVPVLLHGDTEICHYFLDEQALRQHIQAA
ncbi:glutaredoxin family protein [Alysiella filiformis]|uniref:Glutaredoxin-like domain n=1 Tax=Alysiella filiformis DSM 16848 TaxID=1120981 RepID=A0A286EAP3_9NEIS|nr:glutaredoxin family protein [Alysiella filiformis]QMT32275.1 glutaredoxin family protein [Alysiella filiformis]UBQ56804.1 glutaredoxin family protein [Alysiella filiformis DSM 16848]SOD67973.1 Glutaredoxin-like domain [Alysiella filiformis DSM 16848]